MSKHDSAKYAFFYLLSLVALVFMSISVGIIVFQIINKEIVDIIRDYSTGYNDGAMKFAISAIIVSTPIYYLTSRQIYKNLFKGHLDKDAGVRRWLTYFILLVSVIVMIGFLIATINSFLGGDLTTKFILKTLTALIIAGAVFFFYLYDIRRDQIEGKKDKLIKYYAWASLVVVVAVFVASWFYVQSPQETRNQKIDQEIVNDFYQINSVVSDYYTLNNTVPDTLDALVNTKTTYSLQTSDITDPATQTQYEYQKVASDEYKICADFLTSTLSTSIDNLPNVYAEQYKHDKGHQCFSQKVTSQIDSKIPPLPVRTN